LMAVGCQFLGNSLRTPLLEVRDHKARTAPGERNRKRRAEPACTSRHQDGPPGNVEKGVGHNRPNSKRNPCGSNFLRAGIHSWISIGLNDEEHLAELDELAVLRADLA